VDILLACTATRLPPTPGINEWEERRGRRRSRRRVWKKREGEEERNTFPANY